VHHDACDGRDAGHRANAGAFPLGTVFLNYSSIARLGVGMIVAGVACLIMLERSSALAAGA
jgi:hypothetical protein